MLAALGSGRCHVWTLRTGDQYCIRLSSASSLEFLTVSGETLAYVHIIGSNEASYHAEVVTWTLKNQRTSSFRVALLCGDGVIEFSTMLDKKGESLLLFEGFPGHYPEVGPTRFHCTRTTLEGDILIKDVTELPDIRNSLITSLMMEDVLKETNGQAVIRSWIDLHGSDDPATLMLICYNLQEERLEVGKHPVTGFRSVCQRTGHGLEFHWKDAACFLEFEDDHPNLMVIDLQNLTCSKAKMDFPADDPLSKGDDGPIKFRFGDETFLICVYPQGFCVWCFDANVGLFNENIAYKEQRKSNRDRRLLLKRDGEVSSSDDSITRKLD